MNRYRFVLVVSLLAIIALAACAPASTPAPAPAGPAPSNPTPGQSGNANEININFGPGRDADQSPGTAVLTAQGDKTQVVVTFKAGAAGVPQPGHIHEGACPGVGVVKIPLTNAVDGKSTTVINVPLKDLTGGGFAINFHKSTQDLGIYVACGNIK